jgi:endoglucanase
MQDARFARSLRASTATLVAVSAIACSAAPSAGEKTGESVDLVLGGGSLPLRGTTLSGAEFGDAHLPGTFGTDYTYPTNAEVDYFLGKGMTSLRVPFRWERMQPSQGAALDVAELARLDAFVSYATSRGASVILDPHNYARYFGQVVGAGVPDAALADFWSRLAAHYASNAHVVFALMNEPHDLPTEQWEGAAQGAIDAIRATGAKNLILVPGNEWTGAHSWTESWYGTANAVVMLKVTDPQDNYAFEVHEYLDSDFSGTHPECVSATFGSEQMKAFTDWLRANKRRGFLGELGGGANATCFSAVNDQLAFLEANADVYLGWSWWAAGPWWGDYFLSIEPANGQDKPMMSVLEQHLKFHGGTGPAPTPTPSPSPTPPSPTPPSPTPPAPTPPPASGGLTASMTVTSDWQTGYCADVHVHNGSSAGVSGWTLVLEAGSSPLTQAWNVQASRSGTTYTITPVDWNAPIAAGSDADWGFCADGAQKAVVVSVH